MSAKKENFMIKIGEAFPIEKALRKFKRLADSYGVTREYRSREAYQKPSIKEKEKREAAEKRRRKTQSRFGRSRKKL